MLSGLYGTLTLNADGTYSYLLDQTNAALGDLNDGDALQETFAYTITDGYSQATSQLTITINGHTDAPPLFTEGNDVVDFNTVVAGTYINGTHSTRSAATTRSSSRRTPPRRRRPATSPAFRSGPATGTTPSWAARSTTS